VQSEYGSSYQAAAPAMEYVGVGRRLLAVIIDAIIFIVVNAIVGMIFHANVTNVNGTMSYSLSGPGAVIADLFPIVYYIVLEATMGATLGKLALGLRVVKLDGTPISWGESVVRNLLRIVDVIPVFIPYLLGAILIWTSPTKQRLGDRVAKTVVVRRR
jgi:uncharacterized RDD family membrane protein YckC